jgi:hypothetical protein
MTIDSELMVSVSRSGVRVVPTPPAVRFEPGDFAFDPWSLEFAVRLMALSHPVPIEDRPWPLPVVAHVASQCAGT